MHKESSDMFTIRPIGRVRSPLIDRNLAPKQGDEGAPEAWLEFTSDVEPGLRDLRVGDEVLVLTWLDQADRGTLRAHPRDDPSVPLREAVPNTPADRPHAGGGHPVSGGAGGARTRAR